MAGDGGRYRIHGYCVVMSHRFWSCAAFSLEDALVRLGSLRGEVDAGEYEYWLEEVGTGRLLSGKEVVDV